MPLQRSGGATLQTGDVIQSYATQLSSGKALLPLDNSVLDSGTYPILAALMPDTVILNDRYFYQVADTLTHSLDCASDGNFFISAEWSDGDIFQYLDTDKGIGSRNIMTANNDAENTFDLCCSQTGEKAYSMTYDVSGTDFELIRWDGAAGVVRSMSDIVPNVGTTPALARDDKAIVRCSPDGQNVLFIDATQTGATAITYWISTDFGANWATHFTDATGYASKNNMRIDVSEDLNSFLVWDIISYEIANSPSFIVRSGVKTELTAPADWNTLNDSVCVMSPSTNRLFFAGYDDSFTEGIYMSIYHTDDDSTWVKHRFNMSKLQNTPELLFNNGFYSNIEIGNIVASTISEDIIYCVLWTSPNDASRVGDSQEYLMAFNIATDEYTILNKRNNVVVDVAVNTAVSTNLRIKKGDEGNNEWLLSATSSASNTIAKDEVIFGKILQNPDDPFNMNAPQSAPFRVVAD